MKFFKLLIMLCIFIFYHSSSFAEVSKKNCESVAAADTGVKMFKRLKCKLSNDESEGIGKKLKNIFKKKND